MADVWCVIATSFVACSASVEYLGVRHADMKEEIVCAIFTFVTVSRKSRAVLDLK